MFSPGTPKARMTRTSHTEAPGAQPSETPPAVFFVSPVADVKGGAERVLLDMLDNPWINPVGLALPGEGGLATWARSRGIQVRLFELGSVAAVRRRPGFADLAATTRAALGAAAQIAGAAKEAGAEIVHTNGLKVHAIGALARMLHGTPVLAHLHDIPYTRIERSIWRTIAFGVTRTMMVSRPCYPSSGALPRRVAVVRNGIDVAAVPPDLVVPRQLPANPTVGYVGRIHEFKGLRELMAWFEESAPKFPQLRLLVRGRADAEGSAYWTALQPAIDRLAAAGRLRVEGWQSDDRDPYEGIDILAVPSLAPDPSPRVIMEAMLRGIPVIATPVGGIPGLLPSPELGRLTSDAAGFSDALAQLLQPACYARASEAAAAHARAAFSRERFWRDAAEQYRLAAGRGAA